MKEEKGRAAGGRFLLPQESGRCRCKKNNRWLWVTVLLAWDGLLMYMIVRCLIEPVYGAVFVAAVSINLGYQL